MDFNEKFVKEQQSNFEQFDDFIGTKIVNSWTNGIAAFLAKGLEDKDQVELRLPHGTYIASVRKSGESSANINVALEFSKDFVKYINGDIDKMPVQESFDSGFLKMFENLVGFGHIDPESKEGKEYIEENKIQLGIAMTEAELEYFLNSLSEQIGEICKEYEKPDKTYKFEVPDHGEFEFTYGDKITAKFTADKVFKQALKNDKKLLD